MVNKEDFKYETTRNRLIMTMMKNWIIHLAEPLEFEQMKDHRSCTLNLSS